MSSSEEPQSLREVFRSAEGARTLLEASPDARSPEFATTLSATLGLYFRARDQISSVSLFSPNEGIEDVVTSSLPYMLLDYQVAELIQRTPFTDMPSRGVTLRRARAAYESFLSLVDGYGLLSGSDSKLWDRYREKPEQFAVVSSSDAATKRDAKIANFQAEKQLREKLATLKRNPKYLEQGGDEDIVREVHLTSISFAVHNTFQALDSLNRELPMIAAAPNMPTREETVHRGEEDDTTWKLDQPLRRGPGAGPLLSKEGKPLQPFTLVGNRADLRKGVFRPGHNLPTMSIDEYLEEEKRRGNFLEGGTDPQKPEVDEDDMDAVDRETYKAREWDEYTDNNPKGSGNTLNMG